MEEVIGLVLPEKTDSILATIVSRIIVEAVAVIVVAEADHLVIVQVAVELPKTVADSIVIQEMISKLQKSQVVPAMMKKKTGMMIWQVQPQVVHLPNKNVAVPRLSTVAIIVRETTTRTQTRIVVMTTRRIGMMIWHRLRVQPYTVSVRPRLTRHPNL